MSSVENRNLFVERQHSKWLKARERMLSAEAMMLAYEKRIEIGSDPSLFDEPVWHLAEKYNVPDGYIKSIRKGVRR